MGQEIGDLKSQSPRYFVPVLVFNFVNCHIAHRCDLPDSTLTDPFSTLSLSSANSIVPNTDGINTYRSDNVSLLNWDVSVFQIIHRTSLP